MSENATMDWVENVLKIFSFGKRRLFVQDNFRAHLVQSVKELLNKGKTDPTVIPGGALDILKLQLSWNKPIKDQLKEMYDQWMDERSLTHIEGGNMRGPPLKQIAQWILKAQSDLDKVIIIKLFHCCALSIPDCGSEGKEIACFKLEKPLSSALERLKAAMAETAKELLDPITE